MILDRLLSGGFVFALLASPSVPSSSRDFVLPLDAAENDPYIYPLRYILGTTIGVMICAFANVLPFPRLAKVELNFRCDPSVSHSHCLALRACVPYIGKC